MSNSFLLRGRRALLREAAAAWAGLTVGVCIFAIVAIKFTPSIGENAALTVALILSTPIAWMLVNSIRNGRLTVPSLPERPVARAWTEQERKEYWRKTTEFWKSLDPEEREGLQYLASFLGYQLPASIGRPTSIGRDLVEEIMGEFNRIAMKEKLGPMGEVAVYVGPQKKMKVIVEYNAMKKTIRFNFDPKTTAG